jgi:hypothetical protein
MLDLVTPDNFWLTFVNIALGLVCVACVALVVGAAILDRLAKSRGEEPAAAADNHAFVVPGLGTTLADGGEPVSGAPRT